MPLAQKGKVDEFAAGLLEIKDKDTDGFKKYLQRYGIPLTAPKGKKPKELTPKETFIDQLLLIEAGKGMDTFLRLRRMPFWNKWNPTNNQRGKRNTEALINLVSLALETRLSDPQRLRKFINEGLFAKTPEERVFAFAKIYRANDRAAPYLVEALQRTAKNPKDYEHLKRKILQLRKSALYPMLEILKTAPGKNLKENLELRTTILELMDKARVRQAAPYLWYLSEVKKSPSPVLSVKARLFLSEIFGRTPKALPESRLVLAKLAENFYRRKIRLKVEKKTTPNGPRYVVEFWPWNGSSIPAQPKYPHPQDLQYMYGIRFAREALELDPALRPAQITFLSLILDQRYQGRLNAILYVPADPKIGKLLASVDDTLLLDTLKKAFDENNVAVALPVVRALGERGVVKALRAGGTVKSKGLVRALYYPDRRVQMAAARAAINITSKEKSPVVTARVVNILSRFAGTKFESSVLGLGFLPDKRNKPRVELASTGYTPIFPNSPKEAFAAIQNTPDVEAIIIHQDVGARNIPFLLSSIKADSNARNLPVLLLGDATARPRLRTFAEQHKHVVVEDVALLTSGKAMAEVIDKQRLFAKAPDMYSAAEGIQREWLDQLALSNLGANLTSVEKLQLAEESMMLLSKMAEGSIKGYPAKLAKDAFLNATHRYTQQEYVDRAVKMIKKEFGKKVDEAAIADSVLKMAELAVGALDRIPGKEAQQRLADIVVDRSLNTTARKFGLRLTALLELNQHIQNSALVLRPDQVQRLHDTLMEPLPAKADPADVQDFKQQLAVLVGRQDFRTELARIQRRGIGSGSLITGQELRKFPTPNLPGTK